MTELAFARPVAVIRQRVAPTASADRVDLHELDGMPGFLVFRCAALHAEISPTACARNFEAPRSEACTICPIGERFQRETAAQKAPTQRLEYPSSFKAIRTESDIEDRLRRRAAALATGSRLAAHSCVRCERTARTAERLVGRLRLVRDHTLCVSCYNREREVITGKNAKGARPRMWDEKLFETRLVCVEAGLQKRIPIGLSTGVDEALRHAARVHPRARVIGIFVADDFYLLIAPHGEGLDRAKWERRERIAAQKKARAAAQRITQAPSETETNDKHRVSVTEQRPATTVPHKLVIGARVGRLELQRDVGRSKWACRCDCGRGLVMHATPLRGTREPSCGCAARAPTVPHGPPRQPASESSGLRRTPPVVAGTQRGYLTALRPVRGSLWRWRCACGAELTIDLARRRRDCGCGGKERADTATRTTDEQRRAFYATMPAVQIRST
ncbi:hypothetical protein OKW45_003718 [Paraburkholderia sp. WSM4175]|uniref:hypothetical protein n=1 Tax=Paraburkholderia sp. WSM4175 TaxID=2991072 RepID=UPI003D1ECBD2